MSMKRLSTQPPGQLDIGSSPAGWSRSDLLRALRQDDLMKALTWHGKRDVRCEDVADPSIEDDGDVVIRVTSTAICGSDLHLYEVLGPFMSEGDVLGHEPMGYVEAVGPGVTDLAVGDRVV